MNSQSDRHERPLWDQYQSQALGGPLNHIPKWQTGRFSRLPRLNNSGTMNTPAHKM